MSHIQAPVHQTQLWHGSEHRRIQPQRLELVSLESTLLT